MLSVLFVVMMTGPALADEEIFRTGLKEPTPEEMRKLHQKRIRKVKPNILAIERKNHELRAQGHPELDPSEAASPEAELEVEDTPLGATDTLDAEAGGGSAAIPAQVDNSALTAAPPIGNQGSESSCVAWATTYYQMSHETCLVRGCNNKTSNANRFSPKWTYNMVNGGTDGGSTFSSSYSVLAKHGAASLAQLPYVAGDYRSWDLNPADWRSAISFRTGVVQYLSSLNTESGLANAKQLLANGHVMVVGTYINSWVYGVIKADPANASNPFSGQKIMTYQNGSAGAHGMAVVGYDDSVWVDLNGNGVVDSGEKGALKIANSWGTGWGNAGFMWMAYDAIGTTTLVSGGPASSTRTPAFQSSKGYSILAQAAYTPKLLAEFTVNHALRNQMTLSLGTSATSATSPSSTWSPFALNGKGGAYAFNGTTTPVDGTFVLDFTDLVPSGASSLNYYLTFGDSVSGTPGTLKAFSLIDVEHGISIPGDTALPLSADASTVKAKVGYNFTDGNIPPVAMISLSTTSLSPEGVHAQFDGSGSSDGNGSIVSYLWDFGDGSPSAGGITASHDYLKPGTFTATLTVTDNQGATASASTPVAVQDLAAPSVPQNFTANLSTKTVTTGRGKKATTTTSVVVNLSWSASTDNVGVLRYGVFRNGTLLAYSNSTAYVDSTTVAGGGLFTYSVIAYDAAGNASADSTPASVNR